MRSTDSATPRPDRKPARLAKGGLALAVTLLAATVDQATKWVAVNRLTEGEEHRLIGDFLTLTLTYNPGAAFSFLSGNAWVFTIFAVVVLVAIAWAAIRVRSVLLAVILGFIAGGALGNLVDRVFQPPSFGSGHVIDFINYNGWFIGNVADIWIVGGAVALFGYLLFSDRGGQDQSDGQLGESPTQPQDVQLGDQPAPRPNAQTGGQRGSQPPGGQL